VVGSGSGGKSSFAIGGVFHVIFDKKNNDQFKKNSTSLKEFIPKMKIFLIFCNEYEYFSKILLQLIWF
jgi:hypothetical protein